MGRLAVVITAIVPPGPTSVYSKHLRRSGANPTMSDEFEFLSAGEMRARYDLTAENRPAVTLDLGKVPAALHCLVPLAERFGVPDDLIRQGVLAKATDGDLETMRQTVQSAEDALDSWLAGPEAGGPSYSAEYIAFSCLRMAADEI